METTQLVTLYDLMIRQIRNLHDGSLQWSKAVNEFSNEITDAELKQQVLHQAETLAQQAKNLEHILRDLTSDVVSGWNVITKDLIMELNDLRKNTADKEVLHAGLIVTCQAFIHYRLANCGSAASYAKLLGHPDIASGLHEFVAADKLMDIAFTRLAEEKINLKARIPIVS